MKKPNALPTVLFDHTSIGPHSAVFDIPSQVTITAFGLQPDDYITFEALQLTPGARAFACGCVLTPAQEALIADTQQLQCPSCDSAVLRPVRLTPSNPVVVLDSPQGISLRAVYHGTGLDLRSVRVTATHSDTSDLTDAMRGCPPVCCEDEPETWIANGLHRCTASGQVELQETSNCGNTRWVACGPVTWTPTGNERCADGFHTLEQRNQCGHSRWIAPNTLVWQPTGVTRCTATNVERQEADQCGNLRWVLDQPLQWTDTGEQRCSATNVERQQTNQCGTLRWVAGAALLWVDTGEQRCTETAVERQQVSPCGDLRWVHHENLAWEATGLMNCQSSRWYREERNQCGVNRWIVTEFECGEGGCVSDWQPTGATRCGALYVENEEADGCGNLRWTSTATPVNWQPTGLNRCTGAFVEVQEQNACGQTRWTATSTPAGYAPTGQVRCVGAFVEAQEANGCGDTRWVSTGVPVAWTPTGQTRCNNPLNLIEQEEANQCGTLRWALTSTPCDAPCVPNWQNTGTTRCTGANVENFQTDGCGNERWLDTGVPVAWTNNGALVCGPGDTLLQPQVNQCGGTRMQDTGTPCVEPCVPNWQNTGTTRCTGANVENFQQDGCGNTRWFDTGTPVVWTDNGGRQCAGGFYQRNETSQCGTTRWANIAAITWTNTGNIRCTGAFVEAEQSNQCGTIQWVSTGAPVAWTDTGETDCTGANYRIRQSNQCGALRWVEQGPVVWTNTGAPTCVDGTLRQLQTNQCGGTRTVDTGTACGPAAPSLPAGFGGGCFIDSPTVSLSYYQITFGTDGSGVEKIQFGGGSAPFTWAPGAVNGADYEVKVDFTFSGTGTSYNGPANGAWVSLATARTMEWRVSGPAENAATVSGTVSIRRVGAPAAEATATIDSTFIGTNTECP